MLMGHADFPKRKLRLRGGWAAAGPETMRKIIDVLGAKHICAAYGLSEASPNVVMSDWRDPEELRVQGLATPHAEMHLRTVDGEIQVRGWSVMRGYYNNPRSDREGVHRGRLAAHRRPRRAAPRRAPEHGGAPEGRVPRRRRERRAGGGGGGAARAIPRCETAQVVGVPDARLGEVPCAYVSLKSGQQVTAEALIAWTKQRCANFRVPRYVKIVHDFESIGMTASGKVQKAKLREQALRDFRLQ